MTDFSTPCYKKANCSAWGPGLGKAWTWVCRFAGPGLREQLRRVRWSNWCFSAVLGLLLHLGAQAQQVLQSADFGVRAQEEGYYLQATLDFDLPLGVEETLNKGVPLFFVAEVDVFKERWYWSDKLVTHNERHIRLSYQPISRRWRVYIASMPISNTGLGVAMGQNYDSLGEALAQVRRVTRWKIADRALIDEPKKYRYDFRFRLDLSQLPRPLQMGALGDSEWVLSFTRSQQLPSEPSE